MSYDLKVQKHTRRSLWVAIAPVNGARDRRQCEVSTNSMSVENRTEVDVEAAEKPPENRTEVDVEAAQYRTEVDV